MKITSITILDQNGMAISMEVIGCESPTYRDEGIFQLKCTKVLLHHLGSWCIQTNSA